MEWGIALRTYKRILNPKAVCYLPSMVMIIMISESLYCVPLAFILSYLLFYACIFLIIIIYIPKYIYCIRIYTRIPLQLIFIYIVSDHTSDFLVATQLSSSTINYGTTTYANEEKGRNSQNRTQAE